LKLPYREMTKPPLVIGSRSSRLFHRWVSPRKKRLPGDPIDSDEAIRTWDDPALHLRTSQAIVSVLGCLRSGQSSLGFATMIESKHSRRGPIGWGPDRREGMNLVRPEGAAISAESCGSGHPHPTGLRRRFSSKAPSKSLCAFDFQLWAQPLAELHRSNEPAACGELFLVLDFLHSSSSPASFRADRVRPVNDVFGLQSHDAAAIAVLDDS